LFACGNAEALPPRGRGRFFQAPNQSGCCVIAMTPQANVSTQIVQSNSET
jgi:hypothetical protein